MLAMFFSKTIDPEIEIDRGKIMFLRIFIFKQLPCWIRLEMVPYVGIAMRCKRLKSQMLNTVIAFAFIFSLVDKGNCVLIENIFFVIFVI